jgi:DNA-binding response OmpR family regulator
VKILLAEDDLFSSALLSATLKRLGHETTVAANGEAAFDEYRKTYFHIVISDWMMPAVDGLALCRLIRELKTPKYTYIILLTALSGSEAYLEGLKAGADDFLTKPLHEQMLAARLAVGERILKVQEVNRQLAQFILICSYCKKARNDEASWEKLEEFLMQQPELQLSHGICPDCYEITVRPQLAQVGARKPLVR